MKMLDSLCIGAMVRMTAMKDKAKDFVKSQDGVSNVVATIIILLLVVLLISVFWTRLKDWIGNIMDDIFGKSFNDSGLSGGSGL